MKFPSFDAEAFISHPKSGCGDTCVEIKWGRLHPVCGNVNRTFLKAKIALNLNLRREKEIQSTSHVRCFSAISHYYLELRARCEIHHELHAAFNFYSNRCVGHLMHLEALKMLIALQMLSAWFKIYDDAIRLIRSLFGPFRTATKRTIQTITTQSCSFHYFVAIFLHSMLSTALPCYNIATIFFLFVLIIYVNIRCELWAGKTVKCAISIRARKRRRRANLKCAIIVAQESKKRKEKNKQHLFSMSRIVHSRDVLQQIPQNSTL